jgi:hypothetical protein
VTRLTVFLSSTFRDQGPRREKLLDAIRKAGLDPIGMEDMVSFREVPVEISRRYAREADLYLGIVAWRYGSMPPHHDLSYTEIEFDEAGRADRRRMVFIVDDDVPVAASERDPDGGHLDRHDFARRLETFKKRVRTEASVCNLFKSDEDLLVKVVVALKDWAAHHAAARPPATVPPALAPPALQPIDDPFTEEMRRATTRVSNPRPAVRGGRRLFGGRLAGYLVVAASAASIAIAARWALFAKDPGHDLSAHLAEMSPSVFSRGKEGRYWLARVLPNRAAISEETSLKDDLATVRESFDLIATTGETIINNYSSDILNAAKRGVAVRIVLSDYSDAAAASFDAFARAQGRTPAQARAALEGVRNVLRTMNEDLQRTPPTKGGLQIKWNQEVVLYSMWLKDAKREDGVGHLSVYLYGPVATWPSFRFSREAGPLLGNLSAEFDEFWKERAVVLK